MGRGSQSDHYVVVARIRVQRKWVRRDRGGREGGEVVRRVERLQEEECREEWKRVVERRLGSFDLERMEEVEEMSSV